MDEIVRDVNDGWDDVDPGRSKAMQSVLDEALMMKTLTCSLIDSKVATTIYERRYSNLTLALATVD